MTRLFWCSSLLFSIFLCLLYSCTASIETKKTPSCITSHIFAWPIRQLHDSIPTLFRAEDSRQDDSRAMNQLFVRHFTASGADTVRLQIDFMAETADSTLFGKVYFTHGNRQNVYLHCFGDYWNSPTYYATGEALPYAADFAIKLDSLGPRQTSVTIQTLYPHVAHGYGGIGGMCGIVLLKKEVSVPASKTEECALLTYLVTQLPTRP